MENLSNTLLEQTILGILLSNNDTYDLISDILIEEVFYDSTNRVIYKEIVTKLTTGNTANYLTLVDTLSLKGVDKEYFNKLCNTPIRSDNLKSYSEILIELWQRRELLDTVERTKTDLNKESINSNQILENIFGKLQKIYETKVNSNKMYIFKEIINELIKDLKENFYDNKEDLIPLGFDRLDEYLGGAHKGWVITIAARPGIGKTTLALNMATNIVINNTNRRVLFISLEMSYDQLIYRILSSISRVPIFNLINNKLNKEYLEECIRTARILEGLGIVILDIANLNMNQLRYQLRLSKRKYNTQIIFIDYLQLLKSGVVTFSRSEEVAYIIKELKILAKELGVTIVILSQMSRGIEQRENTTPKLSDLSESTYIEQVSDAVVAITYKDKKETKEDILVCNIIKNRNGPTGRIELYFKKSICLITDMIEL